MEGGGNLLTLTFLDPKHGSMTRNVMLNPAKLRDEDVAAKPSFNFFNLGERGLESAKGDGSVKHSLCFPARY